MSDEIKLSAEGKDLLEDASNYDGSKYRKALNTVDICICRIYEKKLQVLLVKRKYPPFKDKWAICGGFVDINKDEGMMDAAKRELFEETGVKGVSVRQLGTYGDDPKRDPRDRVITTVYFALLSPEQADAQIIKPGDDARETKWFNISKSSDLAFDHGIILRDLKKHLRSGIQYEPFAFELVSKKFTWLQLREAYETILGKELIAQNFPRDIKRRFLVEELEEFKAEGRGKPARLINFKKAISMF